MIDLVHLDVRAGDGGNGKVSFWRNKRVLKGGPDGGDGGDGGHIILQVDPKLNTLQHFSGKKKYVASEGQVGGKARKEGARGEDVVLSVPPGTVVWLVAENQASLWRRERHGLEQQSSSEEREREHYCLEKPTQNPPPRTGDNYVFEGSLKFEHYLGKLEEGKDTQYSALVSGKLLKIAVMNQVGQKITLCQGGFGGRGNDAFKSSRNTTPLEAEYGTYGEQKLIFLELRLLANVGLVGFPNAGKSSLLRRLTKAPAKVADYPFTTMTPNLGVWSLTSGKKLVIADIPGLIEGASEGKGLGFTFLRHVQNTKILLFMLALTEEQVWMSGSDEQKATWLYQQYQQLETEVLGYNQSLKQQGRVVVINKIDLYSPPLRLAIKAKFTQNHIKTFLVSVATGEGMEQLEDQAERQAAI